MYKVFSVKTEIKLEVMLLIICVIHRHHFNIMGVYKQRNSTKTRMS
jgi:hypothetical protein